MIVRLLPYVLVCLSIANAASGGELRFSIYSEPKTFNPVLVSDASSETIRYLTAGVLIRANRMTHQLQPELAVSWRLLPKGRGIAFSLRKDVRFSDGTPFSSEDVVYTMRMLFDPGAHSPTAEAFGAAAAGATISTNGPHGVTLSFATPVAALDRLFDQVGIVSRNSAKKELATLGPFFVAEYKPGSEVRLARNPYYWKSDENGNRLPRLDAVRLYIQQNRELELMRFQRGELDLITALAPDPFQQLQARNPGLVRDLGPSMESEMLWFNQNDRGPLPEYKKTWFRSKEFRRAVSAAINRQDLCRLVYHGHARPAEGPISPANRLWFNASLNPHRYDPKEALDRLAKDGFRLQNGALVDARGNAVEFSLITNSGNQARERLAQMIQQDLKAIGIRLNLVKLDYAAIIERISQSFDYESCLLGLTNVDLDPDAQMNVWLSSASNHQWRPSQTTPATSWEAEIDRLMRAQHAEPTAQKRKMYFDTVQQIVWEEAPFLYLVNRNALIAAAPALRNLNPSVLRPQALWNVEMLELAPEVAAKR
jgi:peptide/nickel transport system substrate-binding protein